MCLIGAEDLRPALLRGGQAEVLSGPQGHGGCAEDAAAERPEDAPGDEGAQRLQGLPEEEVRRWEREIKT